MISYLRRKTETWTKTRRSIIKVSLQNRNNFFFSRQKFFKVKKIKKEYSSYDINVLKYHDFLYLSHFLTINHSFHFILLLTNSLSGCYLLIFFQVYEFKYSIILSTFLSYFKNFAFWTLTFSAHNYSFLLNFWIYY